MIYRSINLKNHKDIGNMDDHILAMCTRTQFFEDQTRDGVETTYLDKENYERTVANETQIMSTAVLMIIKHGIREKKESMARRISHHLYVKHFEILQKISQNIHVEEISGWFSGLRI